MKAKKGHFKYIDEDKIVPYLQERILYWDKEGDKAEDDHDVISFYSRASELRHILDKLDNGFWRWEQGSE